MKTNGTHPAVTSSTTTSHVATAVAGPATPAAIPQEIANVPSISAADVAAFIAAIDAFSLLLGAGFVVPQPAEVKRMVKPRKEAPTIVPMVADLSTRYLVASAAYPTSVTLAKQQLVNTLSPVAERIGAVQKLVGSVMGVGQSGAWEGSMVTYGLLKSEARGNAVLRAALAPVREKLRPTYATEAGGKTKVRKRSRSAVAKAAAIAKGEAATGAPVAAAPVTPVAAAPVTPVAVAAAPKA